MSTNEDVDMEELTPPRQSDVIFLDMILGGPRDCARWGPDRDQTVHRFSGGSREASRALHEIFPRSFTAKFRGGHTHVAADRLSTRISHANAREYLGLGDG
ncbi:hypothetical protein PCASD_07395 [Puccinia coronata f. sp. avenae]|uniref:Uncharacterized protein n=1 Tax=Puccinia coronata f. sp. avenae TaxID=200324 RepID=A0A2N5V9C9_9BASI|nr:hypothetical protein PCASD_19296 [Puccinia coronata f. sp. avenae]PLW46617.1 hypothetical protein PCASD_07395 [Puccinia coronata f. sp. avenae]